MESDWEIRGWSRNRYRDGKYRWKCLDCGKILPVVFTIDDFDTHDSRCPKRIHNATSEANQQSSTAPNKSATSSLAINGYTQQSDQRQ